MSRRRLVAIAAAVLACSIPFAASALSGKASVVAEAKLHGPGGVPLGGFKCTSSALKAEDDGKVLKFSVPVSSIDTENSSRTEDMKLRFAKDGPNVVLTVPRDKVKFPTDKPTNGTVQGALSLNGVSQNVPVKYSARKDGGDVVVTASFTLDYTPHHFDLDSKKKEKGVEACKYGVCVTAQLAVSVTEARFKE